MSTAHTVCVFDIGTLNYWRDERRACRPDSSLRRVPLRLLVGLSAASQSIFAQFPASRMRHQITHHYHTGALRDHTGSAAGTTKYKQS